MKTRFKGYGEQYKEIYFDSLNDALKSEDIFEDIYEVDENGKKITSLLHYLPENYWRISVENKNGN